MKCYKWLATDEGKRYTKCDASDDDGNKDGAKQASQSRRGRGNNPANNKKFGSARAVRDYEGIDLESAWMAREVDQADDPPSA